MSVTRFNEIGGEERHLDLGGGGGGAFEGDLGGRSSAQQRLEAEGQLDCVESQRLHSLHLSAEVRTHTAGSLFSTHNPFPRHGQAIFFYQRSPYFIWVSSGLRSRYAPGMPQLALVSSRILRAPP